MRLRDSLLVLALLASLPASAARASVRASGLSCSAVGGSSVSSSSDGRRLVVSNLGSSGQDGVSVSLGRSSGHAISTSATWGDPEVGAVCSWSWGVSNAGSGQSSSSHARVMVHKLHNGQSITVDGSELSSSPALCVLYLDGLPVSSFTCPSSVTLELSSSSSLCAVPDCRQEFGPVQATKRACLFNVGLKGRMTALPPGGGPPVECDQIVVKEQCDDGGATDCDDFTFRCAAPPASSLHVIEFSSQSIVRFGLEFSTATCDLDGSSSVLSVTSNPLYSDAGVETSPPMFDKLFSVTGQPTPVGESSSSVASSLVFDKASPVLMKRSDTGASFSCVVRGTGACSATSEVASLRSTMLSSGALEVSSSFAGMCADQESVYVTSGGLLVASLAMPPSHVITVTPPPGGPLSMAINEKGLPGTKTSTKGSKGPASAVGGLNERALSSSVVGPDGLSLHVAFADPRVVCVDGTCVSGDDITVHGESSSLSNGGAVITIIGQDFSLHGCSSGTCSSESRTMQISNVSHSSLDRILASIPSSVSLSSSSSVVEVPVLMDRIDHTPLRGTTVTLHLSSNLVLASSVRENTMFSSISNQTQMFVVDNGGGSYTVDLALLGPGCGPTDSGSLFSLFVSRAPGAADGVGFVSIDDAEAADCVGGAIPTSPAGPVEIVLDSSPPTAITDLSATQCKTGNDADGTTCVSLVWSPRSNLDESVEVYRASYGNYPLFSRGPSPGSVPSPPATCPPSGRFSSVSSSLVSRCDAATGACTVVDEPSSRDEFYYVAVVRDRAGNVSACSNLTDGTLDYHLGDVAGGSGGGGGGTVGAVCAGDNQVSSIDISALGAHYGSSLQTSSSVACLDVGPTVDGSVDGRPVPDGRLSFRDLILYAINYSVVSMPRSTPAPAALSGNALALQVPVLPEVGATFDVALTMEGAGDALGVSTQLAWDPTVVEPVSVHDGDLLAQQDRAGIVLSDAPGHVDAVLFGVGTGFTGRGALARVTFRVKGNGDAAIRLARVEGRDGRNQPVALAGVGGVTGTPGRTAIRMAFPNPFDRNTTVVLALAQAGPVEVGVFDISGRQVRTLVRGVQPAGERTISWDGHDDHGAQLGAGVYMLRLQAGGHQETRALRLVK